MKLTMKPGNIVEYIDDQKIICAVILEVKDKRLRLLSETNREINISAGRLSHKCGTSFDISSSRNDLIQSLKATAQKRKNIMATIDIKELWEVLNTEQKPIDLATMTQLCFSSSSSDDHESAVVRSFFENRVYFKFGFDSFMPNSEDQVEKIIFQKNKAARKERLVEQGGKWLKSALTDGATLPEEELSEIVEILKSVYLFGKESKHFNLGKAILAKAGVELDSSIFKLLVKLGVWEKNENLDLHRLETPQAFSPEVEENANELVASLKHLVDNQKRKDLTHLPIMTIDGPSTHDFDDALSIEKEGMNYRLGVHIVDVGYFIKRGDVLDKNALTRGSSIYMPDQYIPMLPAALSGNICSLKAGELRPTISIFALLSPLANVIDYEILPSIVKVKRQLTYFDADNIVGEDEELTALYELAVSFRRKRLDAGAIQITLPEINIRLLENGEVILNQVNRESPGRMLVAEMMILANWIMAKFLGDNNIPAVFRSQPGPKERILKNDKGSLFENWAQRRLLSRGVLGPWPEHHSGLGLDAYVTATSPIRKYFDLATQRQIRAVLGLEDPYSEGAIKNMIQVLLQPVAAAGRLQFRRHRYWVLKFLEGKTGTKEDAIVIDKRRNNYIIVITAYMVECKLPLTSGMHLVPGDLIQITFQHINARNDLLSVYMG